MWAGAILINYHVIKQAGYDLATHLNWRPTFWCWLYNVEHVSVTAGSQLSCCLLNFVRVTHASILPGDMACNPCIRYCMLLAITWRMRFSFWHGPRYACLQASRLDFVHGGAFGVTKIALNKKKPPLPYTLVGNSKSNVGDIYFGFYWYGQAIGNGGRSIICDKESW